MSNYFEVNSPNYNYLIDDSIARMSFVRKVQLSRAYIYFEWKILYDGDDWTTNYHSDTSKYTVFKIPRADNEDMCFVSCSNSNFGITCYTEADGHYITVFYPGYIKYYNLDPSPVTVFIFGKPSEDSSYTYGLEIFDADGDIIFSSQKHLLTNIKGIWCQQVTWHGIYNSIAEVTSSISASNTAISVACIPGHGGSYYFVNPIYLPVHFDGNLTLVRRYLFLPSYDVDPTPYQIGGIGCGISLVAIDTSNLS